MKLYKFLAIHKKWHIQKKHIEFKECITMPHLFAASCKWIASISAAETVLSRVKPFSII